MNWRAIDLCYSKRSEPCRKENIIKYTQKSKDIILMQHMTYNAHGTVNTGTYIKIYLSYIHTLMYLLYAGGTDWWPLRWERWWCPQAQPRLKAKGGGYVFLKVRYQNPRAKHKSIITSAITSEHWSMNMDLILFQDSTSQIMFFSGCCYGTVAKGCP